MRVVVDIPEDVYTRLFDNGIQDNEIAVDDVCEMARALRLGAPQETVTEFADRCRECGREKVLDKIKGDIFNVCSDNYHMPVHKLNCDEIFEIIDKYIK